MSKHQNLLASKENHLPKGVSTLIIDTTPSMDEMVGQRVSLQTLQPSARTKGLVGSHGQIVHHGKEQKLKQKHSTMAGKIQVFEDRTSNPSQKKGKMEEKGIQTDPTEFEATKLITSDEIDVEYYSTMAERRRVALAEALEENEQLHQEIDNMRLELDSLKAENTMLKPLAEEAEYLAGVLKELMGSSEEDGSLDQSKQSSDS